MDVMLMDGYVEKSDSRPFDLVCCCELTNLCSHHSDVMPCHLLPVENPSSPDNATVHPDGEMQRSCLLVFYEVPVESNITQETLPHDDACAFTQSTEVYTHDQYIDGVMKPYLCGMHKQ